MKHKSIIINPEDHRCAICGCSYNLEWHHCIHGTANRKWADAYCLTVWLCHDCHRHIHDDAAWRERDQQLEATAQRKFEDKYNPDAHRLWMQIFGKNYLDG